MYWRNISFLPSFQVADFGLSRNNDTADATMTACGTPSWAAPEVIRHQKYSFKADVFSFGICLWEMCTRSKPYEDIPPYQVVIAVAMKVFILPSWSRLGYILTHRLQGLRPKLSSKIHKSFMRLMVQCWDDRPEVRPPFDEISTTLEELQCPHPLNDSPVDASDSVKFGSKSRRNSNAPPPLQPLGGEALRKSRGVDSPPLTPNRGGNTVELTVEVPGAAPAIPSPYSPEGEVPKAPFASPDAVMSLNSSPNPNPSGNAAASTNPNNKSGSLPKKKKWGKFSSYAVHMKSPSEDGRDSSAGSLPAIKEEHDGHKNPEGAAKNGAKPNENSTGDLDASRDFVISL